MSDYSLDFIGRTLLALREEMRECFNQVDARFDRVEARLATLERNDQQRLDENAVLTGMVMRYAGEHIAWGAMERQIKRLAERVDQLEGQPRP